MLIRVSFHGPTNYKGSRWQCHADESPRKYYSYEHELNGTDGARLVAIQYAQDWCNYHRAQIDAFGSYGPAYFVAVSEIDTPREERDTDPAAVAQMLREAHPTWDARALEYGILHHTRDYVPQDDCERLAAQAVAQR